VARDFRGAEIHPGDTVVYVSSGRYTQRGTATVATVHRTKVELRDWEGDGIGPTLVNGHACFVVHLSD
jgi:lipoprotein-anchoring transpeptidase ErfK/SrfK